MPSIFIIPTSNGWNLVRSTPPPSPPARKGSSSNGGASEPAAAPTEQNGSWTVRKLQTLEEAVPLLSASDEFVLGLPLSTVIAQRFRLPSVDPTEFPEMIRLQIEKLLPFPADEVTSDFELIQQSESESVVSAIAIRNERLAELASPLLNSGYIPRQVTVYAAQRASTYAPKGNALLIYPEGEMLVYAMTENGKLSLTRTFERDGDHLQMELPQLRLSAELQGIDASYPHVLLDETCYELRGTVEGIMTSPTEIVGIELPPAPVKLNLLPESWRRRRTQLMRQVEWRKRLIWAGGAYLAVLVLLFVYLGLLRFQLGRLDRRIARDAPGTEFVRATEAKWRAIAPAIDPITTRSKFCSICSKVCRLLMSASLHIISRRAKFPWMEKRTQLRSLTNSSRRSRRTRTCKRFNLTWLRRGSCLTITRNFAWRENPNDAGVVSTNEPARARAVLGCRRDGCCAAQSLDFEFTVGRSRQRAKIVWQPEKQAGRASCVRKRARHLDQTRPMDAATSTRAEKSGGSLCSA